MRCLAPPYPLTVTETVQIPSGTVTLLFTDIEGSTRLWESEPDVMAQALRRHDDMLRQAIKQAGGYVFKTVGDAFCAAFGDADSALCAVLAAQLALVAEPWPTSRPIRVRMGLHTGICEERDGDYFGPVVNRAARLEAVAHGGQVLISGATAELLSGRMPDGVSLIDLGQHRLKDLGRPEHVFQLGASFLTADFPPLSSLDNPELPNNLPCVVSAFIGRERELSEVRDLMRSARLVTLTGPGGSGKTRLALQVAAELIGTNADGVWLAELAQVTDGGQVAAVVAGVLGLSDQCRPSVLESVTDALADQDLLLVLDNCEHVIDAAAKFCDQVIRRCPRVRILATSRETLGIDGERVYRVPSLSLPQADADNPEELAASDAVRLFAERARAQNPGFVLDPKSVPLVASICRRLDGIPLALELAAARLSSMSLAQVAGRLDQRFRLLTGGSRNAMPRQQTLQATVEWSFSLLYAAERETLTRLSVFAGGFDLEAAEQVCATDSVDLLAVMDVLDSLVDKSLVVADQTADPVRYRLLETIRQYSAEELLRTAGDTAVLRLRSRHADYYLSLANAAAQPLLGRDQGRWLRRLDPEWDNLRAAFAHFQAEDRPADIMRLAVALQRFTISRGHNDVLNYLQPAVDRPDVEPSALVASAMLAISQMIGLFLRQDPSELAAARRYADCGLAMAEDVGDQALTARLHGQLAEAAYYTHDLETVREEAELGVAIARRIGDVQLLGEQLSSLAMAATDEQESRRLRLEALDCSRRAGDDLLAANVLQHLYGLDLMAGQLADANDHLEQAVALAEQLGADLFLYFLRSDLGLLRLMQERYADAAPLIRHCLQVARRTGLQIDTSQLVLGAACCATWQGDYDRAARLHGAADADLSRSIELGSIKWSALEQGLREREQRKLRELMGDGQYELAHRAGSALTHAQAVELALLPTVGGLDGDALDLPRLASPL
jgi:predicted ATPase/class 3 adenylate cyclase